MPPNDVEIRTYRDADRSDVVALWASVFHDDPPHNEPNAVLRRKLGTQPELFLVAVDGKELLGTVLGGYDGVRGWVYHVAVHPGSRRLGIGRKLMRAIESQLVELGCPKLNLQVRAGNTAVIAFYQRLGYAVEERASMGKLLGEWAT